MSSRSVDDLKQLGFRSRDFEVMSIKVLEGTAWLYRTYQRSTAR